MRCTDSAFANASLTGPAQLARNWPSNIASSSANKAPCPPAGLMARAAPPAASCALHATLGATIGASRTLRRRDATVSKCAENRSEFIQAHGALVRAYQSFAFAERGLIFVLQGKRYEALQMLGKNYKRSQNAGGMTPIHCQHLFCAGGQRLKPSDAGRSLRALSHQEYGHRNLSIFPGP